jgi:rsbT co-antagonist protein RsbR
MQSGGKMPQQTPIQDASQQPWFQQVLIDSIPNPIFYKDAEGVYRACNDAFARDVLGLPKDRIIGSTVYDLPEAIPPDLADVYHEADMKLIREPGTQIYEAQVKFSDGTRHDVMFHKATVEDQENTVVGMVGVMLDITERKRAEQALKETYEEMEQQIEQERLQQEIIDAQQQALRELATPTVPVLEGVLVMPLQGVLDTARSQQMMETLMNSIVESGAEVVIIDITGVPVVDTSVANHLLQVTRGAKLLGSDTILVGISPEIAQTIVTLGVDLAGIITRGSLQAGIEYALEQQGLEIVRKAR